MESLNEEVRTCRKCRLRETRKNALCGEGDLNADLMLIAQAPGIEEDKTGRMFVGPTGKILDELLDGIDVKRDDIYMTNLVKCMLPKYRKPKQDEIEACSSYVDREIELVGPQVIVPLGYFATKYAFEKYSVELPPKEELVGTYGTLFLAEDRKVLPLQHPTALVHDESLRDELMRSYRKMRIVLQDCIWFPSCPLRRFYEEGKLRREWIELYCRGDWESCVRFQMEERGEPHPDWMLQDGSLSEELRRLI